MLMLRQGGACYYCQQEITIKVDQNDPRRATMDHKIPLTLGGMAYGTNVVASCRRCNHHKDCLDEETYFRVRDDHKARKQAIRDTQAKIAERTQESQRMIHRLIKGTAKTSRQALYDSLQPYVEEAKRNRAGVAER